MSGTQWRYLIGILCVLGITAGPVAGTNVAQAKAKTASTLCLGKKAVSCPSGKVYVGVWQPGVPTDLTALDTFEKDAGRSMALVMLWRDWGGASSTLDTTWLQSIAERGSIPIVTWLPENWDTSEAFGLQAIASGKYDSYITSQAQQYAAYGQPVLLRWADEMNGNWYQWGMHAKAYVAAWRHIHDIFVAQGATNVRWVWCPSVFWPGSQAVDAKQYYPGNKYVDWVALAGYNYSQRGWLSFGNIYGHAYSVLSKRSTKPMMVAEMGSGEATAAERRAGHSKASWIRTAFVHDIPHMPRLKAVIWFNEDKYGQDTHGEDWRIESSASAQKAFASALRATVYRTSRIVPSE